MQVGQLAVRAVQLVFTLIVTALVGNVIQTAFAGNPASINFAIFVCVWAWLAVLYGLAASFVSSIFIPIAIIVMDGVATFLTVIAGIVLAAKLGVHSCNNRGYTSSNGLTNGSHNQKARCQELQAATAFFWFLFATFAASLAMAFMSGGSSSIRGGGIRRGGPSMSQV